MSDYQKAFDLDKLRNQVRNLQGKIKRRQDTIFLMRREIANFEAELIGVRLKLDAAKKS